jgi:hypothetical protein
VNPFALHDFGDDLTYPHGRLLSMVYASPCLALFRVFVDDELNAAIRSDWQLPVINGFTV